MSTLSIPAGARWRPSRFVWLSLGVHGAAAAAVAVVPAVWPWALAAVVLDHVALTAAGLLPRCDWLGANIRRLPAAAVRRRQWALTIDDGPDPDVTPRVLDILDAHGAKATFFVIAERAARERALLAEIVRRGHSVQNHSDRHPHAFSLWGPARIARELLAAQRSLQAAGAGLPRYFRAPAGLRNPFLDPVLQRLGLQLVSWTCRGYDTRVSDPHRVLARLLPALDAGAIVLLHDGHAARSADGTPVVLPALTGLLQAARERGLAAVTLPQGMQP